MSNFAVRRVAARVGLVAVLGALASACAGSTMTPAASLTSKSSASSLAARAVDELPKGTSQEEATGKPGDPKGVPVAIEGSDLVRGSATVLVNAPLPRVREAVLGFADYADFMPHYKKSKVLGRNASGARDVYMEIAALHGAVKMWARLEVPKPSVGTDGMETIEMRFVEGNVKELRGTWRLKPSGADKTELTLEVFLHPSLPLPSGLLNEENVDGAVKGVVAMRDRVEAGK